MTEAEARIREALPGFMRQIEQSRDCIKQWPQWMQDAAYEATATMPRQEQSK